MNDLEYAAGRAYGRYLVTEAGIKLNPVLAKYLGEELANLEPAAKPPARTALSKKLEAAM
jgi:hypothetical protein